MFEGYKRRRGQRLCARSWHAWDRALDDMPEGAVFYRIECTRPDCDYALDGVHLAHTRDSSPKLWSYIKARMP